LISTYGTNPLNNTLRLSLILNLGKEARKMRVETENL